MNKEYDINLILPQEVFKRNQRETLKRDAQRKSRRKKAQIKEWVIAIIQAPFVMALFYFIYCLMYVLIGG